MTYNFRRPYQGMMTAGFSHLFAILEDGSVANDGASKRLLAAWDAFELSQGCG